MSYLKVPVEMAQFALSNRKIRPVQTLLASQFIFSGKARTSDRPTYAIANICNVSERTCYRAFDWLLERNWIGKDEATGWYFFRGIDRIRSIENWQYKRAGIMHSKDLKVFRAYCAGLVLASLAKSGKGERKERLRRRSHPTAHPISLRSIQKTLNVSRSTAYKLRKIAKDQKYIKMIPNMPQVKGISAKDVPIIKENFDHRIMVNLFGSTDSINVHPKQLRTKRGFIYAQLANMITPLIGISSR